MNSGKNYISIEEVLSKMLIGKGILFGDDDFSEGYDACTFIHYHLYGKICSYEIVKNKLVLVLEWAEILYNSAHSGDDWLTYGKDFCVDIELIPGKKYLDSGDRVHLHEKNIDAEDRTFIYIDITNPAVERAKY